MERVAPRSNSAKDPPATATVTDLAKARASRGGWRPAALAASVALAVGLAGGYYAARVVAPGAAAPQIALLRPKGSNRRCRNSSAAKSGNCPPA